MAEEIVVGGYRRLNVMQTGQNSEVWEVTDAATGRGRFAMKLLLPERTDDREQQQQLRREAAISIKLQHPNIIRTVKFGRDGRTVFIIMEYFPSQNLKLRIMDKKNAGKVIKPRLRRIMQQTASALEYMHAQNWVHRDVKPDNVIMNSTGEVRLIDFALAVKKASFFAKMLGRKKLTAGTRSYMSPEQILGMPLDHRADIFSLGVTIFELVTGRLPFVGHTQGDLRKKLLYDPAPSIDASWNVTPEFESLLQSMLVKKPVQRLPSLGDFLTRLRQVRLFNDDVVEEAAPAHAGGMG